MHILDNSSEIAGNNLCWRYLRVGLLSAVLLSVNSLLLPYSAEANEVNAPPDPAPAEWFDTNTAPEDGLLPGPAAPGVAEESLAPELAPAPSPIPVDQNWEAQGPAPTIGGQVEGMPPGEVDGAIHTVVVHPDDDDILWIGTVNGGIWKTTNATAASPTWIPLTDDFPSLSTGAMELDPADPDTILAGIGRFSSFGGNGGPLTGLLLSEDGGNSWTEIDDPLLLLQNISGVAVRGNTMLAASNSNTGSSGVFQSINGGVDWTRISGGLGTGLPSGSVFDLVGDPTLGNIFYASVASNGLYRSIDSGANWVRISQDGGALQQIITDFRNNNTEMAVGNDGRLYVAVLLNGQAQYIGYTDDPTAGSPIWTQMDLPRTNDKASLTISTATNTSPIRIDVTAANHGFRTGDQVQITGNAAATGTWFITVPNAATCSGATSIDCFTLDGSLANGAVAGGTVQKHSGLNPKPKPGGQGGVHFSIRVDPGDDTIVYVGGDRQDSPWPNFIGAGDFSGRLFRGDTTVAPTGAVPSPQWDHLTHSNAIGAIPGGGTANSSSPHADSREMIFDNNGNIVEVDDGGIYRRTSPWDNLGDWTSLNGNLQVTEIHDIAYDTVSDILMGGYQDTGTSEQVSPGSKTWRTLFKADGGDVVIDTTTVANQSTRFWSIQNLGSFSREICGNTNICGGATAVGLTTAGNLVAQFVTPLALNVTDETTLIIGGRFSIWESFDQGDNIAAITALPGPIGASGNAMVYGHQYNPDLIYVGAINQNSPPASLGVYVRTTAGGDLVPTAALFPGGFVTDIVLDPYYEDTVFATDTGNVYVSDDGGASWTDITGNLTAGGAGNFRSLEYVENPGGYDKLIIGTNAGVFASVEPAFDSWFELGSDLPNVPVWDLDYDPLDDVLVAGTLGRGAWTFADISQVGIPAITIPGSLDFGDVCLGGSTVEDLNVCNAGTSDLIVYGISSSGTDADQFAVTTPIPGGYPVVISPDFCFPFQAKFTPTSAGQKDAILTVTSSDPAYETVDVTVSGNAGLPAVTATLEGDGAFGEVKVGLDRTLNLQVSNESSICELEVTNLARTSGNTDFTFAGLPAPQSFPVILPVGSNLDLPIKFTPSAFYPSPVTADFRLTTNAPVSPSHLVFPVSGSSQPPQIQLTGNLDFGEVCKLDRLEKTVQICNLGELNTLNVTNVSLQGAGCAAGGFTIADAPATPFDVSHDFCVNVTARFIPPDHGPHNACDLVVTSNDPDDSPVSIPLSGVAPPPNLVVDPEDLEGLYAFPATVVDDSSDSLGCFSERSVTLRNTGKCPLTITDISAADTNGSIFDNDYTVMAPTQLPPIVLPPGEETLEVTIRFTPEVDADPLAPSEVMGLLSITSDDPDDATPREANLCGESVQQSGVRMLVTDVSSGLPVPVDEVDMITLRSKGKRTPSPINLQWTDHPLADATVCDNLIQYHVDQETLPAVGTTGNNPKSSYSADAKEGNLQTGESFSLGQCEFREFQLELKDSVTEPPEACLLLPKGASCTTAGECCSGKCKGPSDAKSCK